MPEPLRPVPTLDELAADPGRVSQLSPDSVRVLMVRHATVGSVLLAALIAEQPNDRARTRYTGDRLLDVEAVAAKIGKSRSWVEKHPEELPPRRRVGGEALWSEREIEAWIKNRPRWQ